MNGLKNYKLRDVIDRFIDYRGKTPRKVDAGIPLITAKIVKGGRIVEPTEFIAEEEYDSWMTRGYPEFNDVILTTEAPLGEVALLKDPKVALAQRIITLRGKPDVCDNIYLKYYLQSSYGQASLHARSQGSTVEGIKSAELKEMEIFLPDLNTQKEIAEILSSLDDKIDLLQRQNKTLEAMAETLFRQWFVEEAEEGWEEDVLEKYVYFDPKEKIDRNKEYQFFEMKCLSNVDMNVSDGVYRTVSSGSAFRNFDTLLAKITPCLENGKTGFVMHLGEDEVARGSTEFVVMRSKGFVSPYWIYCLARNNDFREKAIQSMTGTSGRQRVQIDELRNIKINGVRKRMSKFHDTVSPFFLKTKSNQTQVRTLIQLRDALLPKLMVGEAEAM